MYIFSAKYKQFMKLTGRGNYNSEPLLLHYTTLLYKQRTFTVKLTGNQGAHKFNC